MPVRRPWTTLILLLLACGVVWLVMNALAGPMVAGFLALTLLLGGVVVMRINAVS